jgi:hypothetical protein
VRRAGPAWLLIKAADEFALPPSSILEGEVTAVLSGRSNADLNKPEAIREDHKKRADIVAARQTKLPELLKLKGARKGFYGLAAVAEAHSQSLCFLSQRPDRSLH